MGCYKYGFVKKLNFTRETKNESYVNGLYTPRGTNNQLQKKIMKKKRRYFMEDRNVLKYFQEFPFYDGGEKEK